MVYFNGIQAPIAQGIERRSPEPGAQVRILLGAPNKRLLDFEKPFCMSIISLEDRELYIRIS